jgi:uncharacterized protein YhhL (DUF1145 family)
LDSATVLDQADEAPEARTGFAPWTRAELPEPPRPKGLGWLSVVGPGVIVLGVAIGSGEFLLGPAAFVRHGLSLLWITLVAVFLQTVLNTELMRYTAATGEPVFTGFMRTRPAGMWVWVYALFFILQVGWPAWAATSAGALFFVLSGRMASAADASTIYLIGVGAFIACAGLLLIGRRIARTLELLNWILVTTILGAFLVLALWLVPGQTWTAAAVGLFGFDSVAGEFNFIPAGADFFLLGALVAYSGCGGILNVTLSNWARDKGYGMAVHGGYIASAVGGQKVNLAHSGFTFRPDAQSLERWRGWLRIVRADQWGVFFVGSILGMVLPALLYVTFMPRGTDISGLGVAAVLAQSMGTHVSAVLAPVIGLLGVWILFKAQLDIIEGTTRSVTELLWSANARIRAWRGGDVRAVYYAVLGVIVVWGMIAFNLAQPIMLLKISANVAGLVLIVASLHVLYLNTRLLPRELRPPLWRRAALVCMAVFYGFFVVLAARSFW